MIAAVERAGPPVGLDQPVERLDDRARVDATLEQDGQVVERTVVVVGGFERVLPHPQDAV